MATGQITIFYTTDFIQLVYVHGHLNQSDFKNGLGNVNHFEWIIVRIRHCKLVVFHFCKFLGNRL